MAREPSPESAEFMLAYQAGKRIFRQGDPGDVMYVIAAGEVSIHPEAQPEEPLAVLRAGDFFGEMALLEGEARSASATARTDSRLLVIDASSFDEVIHRDPEIAIRMLRKLARRLRTLPEGQRGPEVPALEPAPSPAPRRGGSAAAAAPPGAPRGPRLEHGPSGRVFPLPADREATVGRLDSAAGLRPDVDLDALDSGRTVSRRHARIGARGDGFVLVEDIGTANATQLNGKRLAKGVAAPLADGDHIAFGAVELVFRQE